MKCIAIMDLESWHGGGVGRDEVADIAKIRSQGDRKIAPTTCESFSHDWDVEFHNKK